MRCCFCPVLARNQYLKMIRSLVGLVICCVLTAQCSLTPTTYLNEQDKERLRGLLQLNSPFSDVPSSSLYYSLSGQQILTNGRLGSVYSAQQISQICDVLKKNLEDQKASQIVENAYFTILAGNLLNCQLKPGPHVVTSLESILKPDASVTDLYFSSVALIKLGRTIDSAKTSKLLLAALKKDRSFLNIGHALLLASNLKVADMTPFLNEISETIAQADEVDKKYLQFEGGLGVTATIFNGIYSLASAAGKPTSLTTDQVLKFTNYFLNRKTVQTVKGAADLLQVLQLLTQNKYHIPVCISRYGKVALSQEDPIVTIKVTNVLGQTLGTGLSVTAKSTALTGEKSLENVQGDSTLFAFDIFKSKPKTGKLDLVVSVKSNKPDSRVIGNTGGVVSVIITRQVVVEKPEISIHDKDQTGTLKMIPLKYPEVHKDVLEADNTQKVLMKFSIKDKATNELISAHQVFVQFIHEDDTRREVFYVAEHEAGSSKAYKFDLNLAQRGKDFEHVSGKYTLNLIVGDSMIMNPFVWKIASIKLNFPNQAQEKIEKAPWMTAFYSPKKEIHHIFRPQEKRPSSIVSDSFSILVLIPVVVLIALWGKLGVNISNFTLSLSAILFHTSLLSIFVLFTLFWLKMNMFTTIKCLLGTGVMTYLWGHRVLSQLARKRLEG